MRMLSTKTNANLLYFYGKNIFRKLDASFDFYLIINIFSFLLLGLTLLYSASDGNILIVKKQSIKFFIGLILMLLTSQVHPDKFFKATPFFYTFSSALLFIVLLLGHIGKGAQRWLNLGVIHFEPSELCKLALPMMLAYVLHDQPLPPNKKTLAKCFILTAIPVMLVAKQPDLGTATILALSSAVIIFTAGIPWKNIRNTVLLLIISLPLQWKFLHSYQKNRVLTFLFPERDPMGSGYHILQSKIAVGSGAIYGKGWLAGSQSHLKFLPEHTTDFIFAVCGEEFGLVGSLILLCIAFLLGLRIFYIAIYAQTTYFRLVCTSIGAMFLFSVIINIGMVLGLLPVVGIPLPLISYGGSTMVTFMIGFGIVLSIASHKKLLGS
jgi:rod shape determining protein RodA